MALIDDVIIKVKAGNGGNGGTAKKQMFGSKKTSPDGGNGGNGGNIYFVGDANVSDLSLFQYKKEIKGIDGVNGKNKDLDGANAEHVYVKVPFGTSITDIETDNWVEIISDEPFCVAYGGAGGMGNHDYNPELNKFEPRIYEGAKGDTRTLHLVLNLIADVGLVGLPNAGKSSLLKALTNAVPKVGNYPFTTLEPNLGAFNKIIIADIPGLIEGASQGKGLGHRFLKHIKKTKILLHCIDSSDPNIYATYETVRKEFGEFDTSLLKKKEIILLTKTDLVEKAFLKKQLHLFKEKGLHVLPVSIYDENSLEILKEKVLQQNELLTT